MSIWHRVRDTKRPLYLRVLRQFLQTSSFALSLDRGEFDKFFTPGVPRADFLLFERRVVCEVKEIQGLDINKQVKNLSGKGTMQTQIFNRYFCNSIIKALRKGNEQISKSKQALRLPTAFGLIVLENLIPEKLSALTLVSVGNQLMQTELPAVDGILCADMVNYFESETGDKIRFNQFLGRHTDVSKQLSELAQTMVKRFCEKNSIPLKGTLNLDSADQLWHADASGGFKKYTANITFKR